jgi:transcriptional regulator with XRE-family HTH domain
MPDLLSELPTLIRAELSRRRMLQRDLAQHVGTNSSTITRLMRGQGVCDVATFVRLAAWLRLAPEEFAGELVTKAYRRGHDDCAAQVQAVLCPTDTTTEERP